MMGNKFSSHQPVPQTVSETRPPGIKKRNDSVFELYKPPAPTSQSVDVIFFHGLEQEFDYQQAYWTTWLSRDDRTVVWPKDWLSKDLDTERIPARILSVSYDSAAQSHPGQNDTYIIAENLISDIIFDPDVGAGQRCPVILVGHCLGGIIIKVFLLGCLTKKALLSSDKTGKLQRLDNFLKNTMGVFYYATPHEGTRIAEYLAEVMNKTDLNNPLIELLNILSTQTSRINDDFSKLVTSLELRSQAIAESLPTKYMGFTGKLVPEASARHGIDSYYTVSNANHFDVCKAKDHESCNIYKMLRSFIKTIVEDNRTKAEGSESQTQLGRPKVETLKSLQAAEARAAERRPRV